MLPRAILVLLLVMNLAVAAWWLTRDAPAPAATVAAAPTGIPRLRLLSEGRAAVPEPVAPAPACHRFGPYSDAGMLEAARVAAADIAGGAGSAGETTVPGPRPDRWRVALPPPVDGDSAALATRIVAAGFEDTVIVAEGPEAGSIALGRFSTPDAAERRSAALREAGFRAQVHPVGGDSTWIVLPLPEGTDTMPLRARLAALQAQPSPCVE